MPAPTPTRRRALLAGFGALAAPAIARAADAPAADAAAVDPAVTAYIARTQAEQQAALDRRVGNFTRELYTDPRSGWIGAEKGDVTLVEFFDYNCAYSQAVEPRVQALLKSDPGVRLVLKQFPIEDAARSPPAARAALASLKQGQDRFAAFHQAMLAFHARFLSDQDIDDRAEKAELNLRTLHRDMAEPEYSDQLLRHMNLARALRIFQTPTFIIDGHVITTPSAEIDFPGLMAKARAARRG